MSSCSEETFYDLDRLKRMRCPVDDVIDHIADSNANLGDHRVPNNGLPMFNDVTMGLVSKYRKDAASHVRLVLNNLEAYGQLFVLADRPHYNSMDVSYREFPLLRDAEEVWSAIESDASAFFPRDTLKYDVTCLHMIYFYALLVNPRSNWITMDYVTNGNRNHQYHMIQECGLWPPSESCGGGRQRGRSGGDMLVNAVKAASYFIV